MWFHIHGLSGNEGIEEILNDDNTLNMVEYSKGYDSIDVFMVENEAPLAVSHGGLINIDEDANNNSSMANAGHDQREQTETRMQGQQSFCTDEDTNNYTSRANAGHDQGEKVQTVQPNESSSELSDETYRPSGQSGDVEIGNDSNLSDASWLYDDFEGDEDNIFNNEGANHGPNLDPNEPAVTPNMPNYPHEEHIGMNTANAANVEGCSRTAENTDLGEDVMAEFNESAHYEDGLHSLQSSNDERRHAYTEYNEQGDIKNPHLEKGMKFSTHRRFREALRAWAIARGYAFKFIVNNKKRITAVCEEKCGFRIHASQYKDTSSFQIKTFRPEHTCPKKNLGHMVNSKYIMAKKESNSKG